MYRLRVQFYQMILYSKIKHDLFGGSKDSLSLQSLRMQSTSTAPSSRKIVL